MILCFRKHGNGCCAVRSETIVAVCVMKNPAVQDGSPLTTIIVQNGLRLHPIQTSEDQREVTERWDAADSKSTKLVLQTPDGHGCIVRADRIACLDQEGQVCHVRLKDAAEALVVLNDPEGLAHQLGTVTGEEVVDAPPQLWAMPPVLSEAIERARIDAAQHQEG